MTTATITSVSAQRLGELLQQGEAEILDVRTPVEFREIHVTGEERALDSLDPHKIIKQLGDAGDRSLYIICRSGNRSATACQKFIDAGYPYVVNVEGGTNACAQLGLSVVRGGKAISLERQVRIAAGSLVLLGVALGALVHPYLYGLAAFIGAGLLFSGLTDTCGMGMVLAKMPWNQVKNEGTACSPS